MAQRITYPNKNPGDQYTSAEANQVKSVVNFNADEQERQEIVPLFVARETDPQAPLGTGNPIQVVFGPPQNGGGDPAQIDAAGKITINQAGFYSIIVTLNISRRSDPGVAIVFTRLLINGIQQFVNAVELNDADQSVVVTLATTGLFFNSGDEITIEMARDPSGANQGSLIGLTATGGIAGWGQSPSSVLSLSKVG